MKHLVALTVPSRLVIPIGSFTAAVLILKGFFPLAAFLPLAILCVADSASSVLNSLSDVPSDGVNAPSRPLVKRLVSRKTSWLLFAFLALASLISSFLVNSLFFIVVAARLFFELIYSTFQAKRFFLINHVLVGVTYGIVPLVAACVFAGQPFPSLFVYFVLLVVCLTPLKDVPDVEGDERSGVATLPVVVGEKITVVVVWLACFLLSSAFFLFGVLAIVPFTASLVFLSLFASGYSLILGKDKKRAYRSLLVVSSTVAGVIVEFFFAFLR
ncbi:MAG: UbiA family prenyltransferase [Candidatus Norongarragalinales archaeon]